MTKEKGHAIVTQEDVANHAGVSRAVVSYVLNNGPRGVSEETKNRVLAAIEELGYRPNKHAQRLRLGDDVARNSIGIIVGGKSYNLLERSYYNTLLATLFNRAHDLNQYIRFFTFFEALKDPVFFNKNIHREEISALLILLPSLILEDPEHQTILPRIIERMDNILCLETSIYDLPALVIDLVEAAEMAVEHLIKLGHQQIGFLSLHDQQRITGYKRALKTHNLPFEVSLVRQLDSECLYESAYELTTELVNAVPPLTAILTANDDAALAALAALDDLGLSVPQDISITSIDNTDLANLIRPALTTVNIPIREMGEYALELLLSLHNQSAISPASLTFPTTLVVRASTGAISRARSSSARSDE
jgi:LacI family transcriptional regulator